MPRPSLSVLLSQVLGRLDGWDWEEWDLHGEQDRIVLTVSLAPVTNCVTRSPRSRFAGESRDSGFASLDEVRKSGLGKGLDLAKDSERMLGFAVYDTILRTILRFDNV